MSFFYYYAHTKLKRMTALVLACIFCITYTPDPGFTQTVVPSTQADQHQIAVPGISEGLLDRIMDISIPKTYGKNQKSYYGDPAKTLVLIQDSHTNLEAQSNYARILDLLIQKIPLKLIGLEGANGALNVIQFKSIPDATIKKHVAEEFLKEGFLTGAEYFAIFSEKPITLYGIDDAELYRQNLKDFQQAQKIKEEVAKALQFYKETLTQLEKVLFSHEFQEFFSVIDSYHRMKIAFTQYLKELQSFAKKRSITYNNFTNVTKMLEAIGIRDTIHSQSIKAEQTTLIKELQKKLVQEEFADVIRKSIQFRLRKISDETFYLFLFKKAQEGAIDLALYPNLSSLFGMFEIKAGIDKTALKTECKQLEEKIAASLAKTAPEQELYKLLTNVRIYENFIDLKMTHKDLEYFVAHRDDFQSEKILAFLTEECQKHNLSADNLSIILSLDDHLPILEAFYEVATKRDKKLVENILSEMDRTHERLAALVTGGFHTQGMIDQLKERNISHTVITPVITDLGAETPYLSVMMEEENPIMRLLLAKGTRLAPAVLLSSLTPLVKAEQAEALRTQAEIFIKALAFLQFKDVQGLTSFINDRRTALEQARKDDTSGLAETVLKDSEALLNDLEKINEELLEKGILDLTFGNQKFKVRIDELDEEALEVESSIPLAEKEGVRVTVDIPELKNTMVITVVTEAAAPVLQAQAVLEGLRSKLDMPELLLEDIADLISEIETSGKPDQDTIHSLVAAKNGTVLSLLETFTAVNPSLSLTDCLNNLKILLENNLEKGQLSDSSLPRIASLLKTSATRTEISAPVETVTETQVNIATATPEELMKALQATEGIGQELAQRIVDERAKRDFTSFRDLGNRVNGIGAIRLAALHENFTGLAAYDNAPPVAASPDIGTGQNMHGDVNRPIEAKMKRAEKTGGLPQFGLFNEGLFYNEQEGIIVINLSQPVTFSDGTQHTYTSFEEMYEAFGKIEDAQGNLRYPELSKLLWLLSESESALANPDSTIRRHLAKQGFSPKEIADLRNYFTGSRMVLFNNIDHITGAYLHAGRRTHSVYFGNRAFNTLYSNAVKNYDINQLDELLPFLAAIGHETMHRQDFDELAYAEDTSYGNEKARYELLDAIPEGDRDPAQQLWLDDRDQMMENAAIEQERKIDPRGRLRQLIFNNGFKKLRADVELLTTFSDKKDPVAQSIMQDISQEFQDISGFLQASETHFPVLARNMKRSLYTFFEGTILEEQKQFNVQDILFLTNLIDRLFPEMTSTIITKLYNNLGPFGQPELQNDPTFSLRKLIIEKDIKQIRSDIQTLAVTSDQDIQGEKRVLIHETILDLYGIATEYPQLLQDVLPSIRSELETFSTDELNTLLILLLSLPQNQTPVLVFQNLIKSVSTSFIAGEISSPKLKNQRGNEDAKLDLLDRAGIAVVFDGAGGHEGGQIASSTSRDRIEEYLDEKSIEYGSLEGLSEESMLNLLQWALEEAHEAVTYKQIDQARAQGLDILPIFTWYNPADKSSQKLTSTQMTRENKELLRKRGFQLEDVSWENLVGTKQDGPKGAMMSTGSIMKFWTNPQTGKRKLLIANIGDSRVYRLRNGALSLHTIDDSYIETLLQNEIKKYEKQQGIELDQKDPQNAPFIENIRDRILSNPLFFNRRNVVTSMIGYKSGDFFTETADLEDDDIILSCSDGVHDNLTDEEIQAILEEYKNNPEEAANVIVKKAFARSLTRTYSLLTEEEQNYRYSNDALLDANYKAERNEQKIQELIERYPEFHIDGSADRQELQKELGALYAHGQAPNKHPLAKLDDITAIVVRVPKAIVRVTGKLSSQPQNLSTKGQMIPFPITPEELTKQQLHLKLSDEVDLFIHFNPDTGQFILNAPQIGYTNIPLKEGAPFTIGRTSKDLLIPEVFEAISRRHLDLEIINGNLFIRHLQNTSSTSYRAVESFNRSVTMQLPAIRTGSGPIYGNMSIGNVPNEETGTTIEAELSRFEQDLTKEQDKPEKIQQLISESQYVNESNVLMLNMKNIDNLETFIETLEKQLAAEKNTEKQQQLQEVLSTAKSLQQIDQLLGEHFPDSGYQEEFRKTRFVFFKDRFTLHTQPVTDEAGVNHTFLHSGSGIDGETFSVYTPLRAFQDLSNMKYDKTFKFMPLMTGFAHELDHNIKRKEGVPITAAEEAAIDQRILDTSEEMQQAYGVLQLRMYHNAIQQSFENPDLEQRFRAVAIITKELKTLIDLFKEREVFLTADTIPASQFKELTDLLLRLITKEMTSGLPDAENDHARIRIYRLAKDALETLESVSIMSSLQSNYRASLNQLRSVIDSQIDSKPGENRLETGQISLAEYNAQLQDVTRQADEIDDVIAQTDDILFINLGNDYTSFGELFNTLEKTDFKEKNTDAFRLLEQLVLIEQDLRFNITKHKDIDTSGDKQQSEFYQTLLNQLRTTRIIALRDKWTVYERSEQGKPSVKSYLHAGLAGEKGAPSLFIGQSFLEFLQTRENSISLMASIFLQESARLSILTGVDNYASLSPSMQEEVYASTDRSGALTRSLYNKDSQSDLASALTLSDFFENTLNPEIRKADSPTHKMQLVMNAILNEGWLSEKAIGENDLFSLLLLLDFTDKEKEFIRGILQVLYIKNYQKETVSVQDLLTIIEDNIPATSLEFREALQELAILSRMELTQPYITKNSLVDIFDQVSDAPLPEKAKEEMLDTITEYINELEEQEQISVPVFDHMELLRRIAKKYDKKNAALQDEDEIDLLRKEKETLLKAIGKHKTEPVLPNISIMYMVSKLRRDGELDNLEKIIIGGQAYIKGSSNFESFKKTVFASGLTHKIPVEAANVLSYMLNRTAFTPEEVNTLLMTGPGIDKDTFANRQDEILLRFLEKHFPGAFTMAWNQEGSREDRLLTFKDQLGTLSQRQNDHFRELIEQIEWDLKYSKFSNGLVQFKETQSEEDLLIASLDLLYGKNLEELVDHVQKPLKQAQDQPGFMKRLGLEDRLHLHDPEILEKLEVENIQDLFDRKDHTFLSSKAEALSNLSWETKQLIMMNAFSLFNRSLEKFNSLSKIMEGAIPGNTVQQLSLSGMKFMNDVLFVSMALTNIVKDSFFQVGNRVMQSVLGNINIDRTFKSNSFSKNVQNATSEIITVGDETFMRQISYADKGETRTDTYYRVFQTPEQEQSEQFTFEEITDSDRIESLANSFKTDADVISWTPDDRIRLIRYQLNALINDWARDLPEQQSFFDAIYRKGYSEKDISEILIEAFETSDEVKKKALLDTVREILFDLIQVGAFDEFLSKQGKTKNDFKSKDDVTIPDFIRQNSQTGKIIDFLFDEKLLKLLPAQDPRFTAIHGAILQFASLSKDSRNTARSTENEQEFLISPEKISLLKGTDGTVSQEEQRVHEKMKKFPSYLISFRSSEGDGKSLETLTQEAVTDLAIVTEQNVGQAQKTVTGVLEETIKSNAASKTVFEDEPSIFDMRYQMKAINLASVIEDLLLEGWPAERKWADPDKDRNFVFSLEASNEIRSPAGRLSKKVFATKTATKDDESNLKIMQKWLHLFVSRQSIPADQKKSGVFQEITPDNLLLGVDFTGPNGKEEFVRQFRKWLIEQKDISQQSIDSFPWHRFNEERILTIFEFVLCEKMTQIYEKTGEFFPEFQQRVLREEADLADLEDESQIGTRKMLIEQDALLNAANNARSIQALKGLIDTFRDTLSLSTETLQQNRAKKIDRQKSNLAAIIDANADNYQRITFRDNRNSDFLSSRAFAYHGAELAQKYQNTQQQVMVGMFDVRGFAYLNFQDFNAIVQRLGQKVMKRFVDDEGNFTDIDAFMAEWQKEFTPENIADQLMRLAFDHIQDLFEARKYQVLYEAFLLNKGQKDSTVNRDAFLVALGLDPVKVRDKNGNYFRDMMKLSLNDFKVLAEQTPKDASAFLSEMGLANQTFIIARTEQNDGKQALIENRDGQTLGELFSDNFFRKGGDEVEFVSTLMTEEMLIEGSNFVAQITGMEDEIPCQFRVTMANVKNYAETYKTQTAAEEEVEIRSPALAFNMAYASVGASLVEIAKYLEKNVNTGPEDNSIVYRDTVWGTDRSGKSRRSLYETHWEKGGFNTRQIQRLTEEDLLVAELNADWAFDIFVEESDPETQKYMIKKLISTFDRLMQYPEGTEKVFQAIIMKPFNALYDQNPISDIFRDSLLKLLQKNSTRLGELSPTEALAQLTVANYLVAGTRRIGLSKEVNGVRVNKTLSEIIEELSDIDDFEFRKLILREKKEGRLEALFLYLPAYFRIVFPDKDISFRDAMKLGAQFPDLARFLGTGKIPHEIVNAEIRKQFDYGNVINTRLQGFGNDLQLSDGTSKLPLDDPVNAQLQQQLSGFFDALAHHDGFKIAVSSLPDGLALMKNFIEKGQFSILLGTNAVSAPDHDGQVYGHWGFGLQTDTQYPSSMYITEGFFREILGLGPLEETQSSEEAREKLTEALSSLAANPAEFEKAVNSLAEFLTHEFSHMANTEFALSSPEYAEIFAQQAEHVVNNTPGQEKTLLQDSVKAFSEKLQSNQIPVALGSALLARKASLNSFDLVWATSQAKSEDQITPVSLTEGEHIRPLLAQGLTRFFPGGNDLKTFPELDELSRNPESVPYSISFINHPYLLGYGGHAAAYIIKDTIYINKTLWDKIEEKVDMKIARNEIPKRQRNKLIRALKLALLNHELVERKLLQEEFSAEEAHKRALHEEHRVERELFGFAAEGMLNEIIEEVQSDEKKLLGQIIFEQARYLYDTDEAASAITSGILSFIKTLSYGYNLNETVDLFISLFTQPTSRELLKRQIESIPVMGELLNLIGRVAAAPDIIDTMYEMNLAFQQNFTRFKDAVKTVYPPIIEEFSAFAVAEVGKPEYAERVNELGKKVTSLFDIPSEITVEAERIAYILRRINYLRAVASEEDQAFFTLLGDKAKEIITGELEPFGFQQTDILTVFAQNELIEEATKMAISDDNGSNVFMDLLQTHLHHVFIAQPEKILDAQTGKVTREGLQEILFDVLASYFDVPAHEGQKKPETTEDYRAMKKAMVSLQQNDVLNNKEKRGLYILLLEDQLRFLIRNKAISGGSRVDESIFLPNEMNDFRKIAFYESVLRKVDKKTPAGKAVSSVRLGFPIRGKYIVDMPTYLQFKVDLFSDIVALYQNYGISRAFDHRYFEEDFLKSIVPIKYPHGSYLGIKTAVLRTEEDKIIRQISNQISELLAKGTATAANEVIARLQLLEPEQRENLARHLSAYTLDKGYLDYHSLSGSFWKQYKRVMQNDSFFLPESQLTALEKLMPDLDDTIPVIIGFTALANQEKTRLPELKIRLDDAFRLYNHTRTLMKNGESEEAMDILRKGFTDPVTGQTIPGIADQATQYEMLPFTSLQLTLHQFVEVYELYVLVDEALQKKDFGKALDLLRNGYSDEQTQVRGLYVYQSLFDPNEIGPIITDILEADIAQLSTKEKQVAVQKIMNAFDPVFQNLSEKLPHQLFAEFEAALVSYRLIFDDASSEGKTDETIPQILRFLIGVPYPVKLNEECGELLLEALQVDPQDYFKQLERKYGVATQNGSQQMQEMDRQIIQAFTDDDVVGKNTERTPQEELDLAIEKALIERTTDKALEKIEQEMEGKPADEILARIRQEKALIRKMEGRYALIPVLKQRYLKALQDGNFSELEPEDQKMLLNILFNNARIFRTKDGDLHNLADFLNLVGASEIIFSGELIDKKIPVELMDEAEYIEFVRNSMIESGVEPGSEEWKRQIETARLHGGLHYYDTKEGTTKIILKIFPGKSLSEYMTTFVHEIGHHITKQLMYKRDYTYREFSTIQDSILLNEGIAEFFAFIVMMRFSELYLNPKTGKDHGFDFIAYQIPVLRQGNRDEYEIGFTFVKMMYDTLGRDFFVDRQEGVLARILQVLKGEMTLYGLSEWYTQQRALMSEMGTISNLFSQALEQINSKDPLYGIAIIENMLPRSIFKAQGKIMETKLVSATENRVQNIIDSSMKSKNLTDISLGYEMVLRLIRLYPQNTQLQALFDRIRPVLEDIFMFHAERAINALEMDKVFALYHQMRPRTLKNLASVQEILINKILAKDISLGSANPYLWLENITKALRIFPGNRELTNLGTLYQIMIDRANEEGINLSELSVQEKNTLKAQARLHMWEMQGRQPFAPTDFLLAAKKFHQDLLSNLPELEADVYGAGKLRPLAIADAKGGSFSEAEKKRVESVKRVTDLFSRALLTENAFVPVLIEAAQAFIQSRFFDKGNMEIAIFFINFVLNQRGFASVPVESSRDIATISRYLRTNLTPIQGPQALTQGLRDELILLARGKLQLIAEQEGAIPKGLLPLIPFEGSRTLSMQDMDTWLFDAPDMVIYSLIQTGVISSQELSFNSPDPLALGTWILQAEQWLKTNNALTDLEHFASADQGFAEYIDSIPDETLLEMASEIDRYVIEAQQQLARDASLFSELLIEDDVLGHSGLAQDGKSPSAVAASMGLKNLVQMYRTTPQLAENKKKIYIISKTTPEITKKLLTEAGLSESDIQEVIEILIVNPEKELTKQVSEQLKADKRISPLSRIRMILFTESYKNNLWENVNNMRDLLKIKEAKYLISNRGALLTQLFAVLDNPTQAGIRDLYINLGYSGEQLETMVAEMVSALENGTPAPLPPTSQSLLEELDSRANAQALIDIMA